MEYFNVDVTHHEDKAPLLCSILEESISKADVDTVIVNGLQPDRLDTVSLVELSKLRNIDLFGVEINKDRAKTWSDTNAKVIVADVDYLIDSEQFMEILSKRRVFVYDNLSGGTRVIDRLRKLIDKDEVVAIATYIMNRGVVKQKLRDLFPKLVEYNIANSASILFYSKFLSEKYSRVWLNPNHKHKMFVRINRIRKETGGMHCPRCGVDQAFLSVNSTVKPLGNRYRCCKCKISFSKGYLTPLSNREFRSYMLSTFKE